MRLSFPKPKQDGSKIILIAILIALIAAISTYVLISSTTAKSPVLTAKYNITKGDPLNKSMFNITYLPKGGIPENIIDSTANLDTVIAGKDLSPGDILRETSIIKLEEGNPSLLSARLKALEKQGLVGGEIPVASVQGMLDGMKAGDMVYLVGVKKDQSNPNLDKKGEAVTEKAIVVGVRSGEDGSGALIVAITKDDAKKIAEARENGVVYAYLYPFGENLQNITEPEGGVTTSNEQ